MGGGDLLDRRARGARVRPGRARGARGQVRLHVERREAARALPQARTASEITLPPPPPPRSDVKAPPVRPRASPAQRAAVARVIVKAVSSSRSLSPPAAGLDLELSHGLERPSRALAVRLARLASVRFATHGGIFRWVPTFFSGTPASSRTAARWTSRSLLTSR